MGRPPAKLTVVKPLQERIDECITEIRSGVASRPIDLQNKYELPRGIVRGLIDEYAPPGSRIKLRRERKAPATVQASLPFPEPLQAAPVAAAPVPAAVAPKSHVAPVFQCFLGCVCVVLAVGFETGNATMNYRFGVSLAQDDTARLVLGGIGIAGGIGALILFAAAGWLWEQRYYLLSLPTFLAWVLCVGMSIGAALGFASSNIGDALQARDTVKEQRTALTEQKQRAEVDRKAIREAGNPNVLENQMNDALGAVPRRNRDSSDNCKNPTWSAIYCAEYVRLKDAYTAAKARVDLDEKISALTSQIAALPSVSEKDPGAEQIAQMSFGLATPEQARSYLMRCFAIISVLASGLLLAIARALLR